MVNLNQTINGLGTVRRRNSSGAVHAAFVETLSIVRVLNSFENPAHGSLSTHVINPIVGAPVTRIGIGTGMRHGTIRSNTYTFQYLIGLIDSSIYSRNGDSGAPVFCSISHHAVGMHMAGLNGIQGGEVRSISVRVSLINEMFGLTRY